MRAEIIQRMTNTPQRKSLYHFTRVDNLPSIATSDALYASNVVHPNPHGKRRMVKETHQRNGHTAVLNAHLQISTDMMDTDTNVNEFRAYLDQHVFLWPTLRLCKQMLQTYSRREPCEKFTVLQLDAYSLLYHHYDRVRLSKYDAGSMPRYPKRTAYRKTLRMFLPLDEFHERDDSLVPRTPSEVHEILIHRSVSPVRCYLQAVYCTNIMDVPSQWIHLYKSLMEIQSNTGQV